MGSAGQFGVVDGCASCTRRGDIAFCNLPSEILTELDQMSYAVTYPQQVVLFSEGQPCRGVFLLCSGRAKVSASLAGKPLMLRVAEAGEVLGLSAVFSSATYELTAQTLTPSVVRFVKRDEFIQLLGRSAEALTNVMRALSLEYLQAVESLRNLALLNTATARVAHLLLTIGEATGEEGKGRTAKLLWTQEQIAQLTATTRETVTRLLLQLRRDRVISIQGSNLIIRDRQALKKLAS
jgi:CRP/FNR family transcriptional regulator, cyclic AMP receptor protein